MKHTKFRSYEATFLSYKKKEGELLDGQRPTQDPGSEPGAYTRYIVTMGKGMNNVNFGAKYEFKTDSNPGAGTYDPEKAIEATKPKVRGAVIREQTSPFRRPQENLPDPGSYAPADINTFGKDINTRVTMGSKYEFKPTQGPAPGPYDADRASSVTKPRTRAAVITEDHIPED